MHEYATTTPEARELVAELEFVWDQIKSNTASSSSSSPGHRLAGSHIQQGHESGSAGLRMLRPVSDADEEGDEAESDEDDDDEYAEPQGGETYKDDLPIMGRSSDLDVRNRKWRRRIEKALFKITTEVAALREQIEAKRIAEGRRRNGVWAWMIWLIWVALRHMLLDLTLLSILVIWARRKRDRRVEMGVGLLVQYLGEQTRRLIRPLRLPEAGR